MPKQKKNNTKTTNTKSLSTKFEEVRLIYLNRTKAKDRPEVRSPDAAYKILLNSWDKNQINLVEECKILLLDRSLRLMSIASVSKGGLSGTVVDPRVIFSIALKRRASSIILSHNHPSGNLKPSEADLKLTSNLMKSGKLLQIPLNDHLIITPESYCSLMTENHIDFDFS